MLLSEAIIPYAGTQGIRLYQTRPEVKAVLREVQKCTEILLA